MAEINRQFEAKNIIMSEGRINIIDATPIEAARSGSGHDRRGWQGDLHHDAIESLSSVIRKAINKRKLYPHDDSEKNVVYLATLEASKNWTMSIRNWCSALNHFMIIFETRL
ncbi:MAG: hypothetical protein QS721_10460 [Candidatus Endonucleobacter sp. (ex Gigantidas childressi)]|nr:hypothetical protein [Candidatus Endonucleobacter sp. (ex Gigantidas childressi)]